MLSGKLMSLAPNKGMSSMGTHCSARQYLSSIQQRVLCFCYLLANHAARMACCSMQRGICGKHSPCGGGCCVCRHSSP